MAHLNMNFDVVDPISPEKGERIKNALERLDGINQVEIDFHENKVNEGYTPGMITVQSIKEAIENQGVDVSDRGDD